MADAPEQAHSDTEVGMRWPSSPRIHTARNCGSTVCAEEVGCAVRFVRHRQASWLGLATVSSRMWRLFQRCKHWINVCCKRFEKSHFCGESRFPLDVLRIPSLFSELFNENQNKNALMYQRNCMDPSIFEFFVKCHLMI
jgi:hypothetical protein